MIRPPFSSTVNVATRADALDLKSLLKSQHALPAFGRALQLEKGVQDAVPPY
jgi:hypothetical protein